MNDPEFYGINQDFFITPDGGTEPYAASDDVILIQYSVKNRDKYPLYLNFEKIRLSSGDGCI
ncbi:MAG: hypothetical protein LBI70_01970 [Rickettsiales bacterium]|nr:hypothetical protein [Rickettsiales bacterium]